MAQALVEAIGVGPGQRVLEVGGGSGQVAATVARHWGAQVLTLEPWTDGAEIMANAAEAGVANQVLAMKLRAEELPFPDNSFDGAFSIGAFEMIGEQRPTALRQIMRVLRPGARFGIAEPMCLGGMPADLQALDREASLGFESAFRTVEWNQKLFAEHGLKVAAARSYEQAYEWWLQYAESGKISEDEKRLIRQDGGRWLTLGLVVGEKV